MRIALLTDGIYPYVMGGMQKHSYYLAKFLAKEGVHVDLYHFIPQDINDKFDVFTEEEFKFIDLIELTFPKIRAFPGHYILSNYLYSKQVYEEFKKRQSVDFIYAKGFTGWSLLQAKKRGQNIPPIGVNFHGLEMYQRPPSFKVLLQLYMLRAPVSYNLHLADYTFSYGGKISDILKSLDIHPNKIIEIPTGIAAEWLPNELSELNSSTRSFVFVGRYERRKGVEELNEVIKDLLHTYNFKMNFIGPIPEDKKIESDKVIYWGSVSEQEKIRQLLRDNDVLLCPSHSEGMPNVIMEGMSSGLAIIATAVGAVSTMVSADNGWLLPAGNKLALKQAIIEAIKLGSKELHQKKSASLQQVKKSFTWEAVIKTTIKEIKTIVSKSSTKL